MLRKDMTDEQGEAASLRQGVESRIRRLRVLVDRIESEALAALSDAEAGRGRYSGVSEVFVKELAWGLANTGVEQLVYYAATADIYHAEAKKQQELEELA